jgi:hypothetical protein
MLISAGVLASAAARAEVVTTLNLPVADESWHKQLSGEWNFEVGGGNYDEGKDEGVLTYFYLRGKFDYKFTSWMRAYVAPRLDLYASRVQERYEDDDLTDSRIRFSDAYVSLEPIDFFTVRAGAVGQYFLESPILVSGRKAFPGFYESLRGNWNQVQVEFVAQQVVPTSNTLNTERTDKEALPVFQTQSVNVKGHYQNWLEGSIIGGHFTWDNLPSEVAFESALTGNNVNGEVAPGATFLYGFNGVFWSSEITLGPQGGPQAVLEYGGINNTSAPSNAGKAEIWGGGPRLVFGDTQLDLRYRRYFIESDATVGLYNYARLGNNNRIGDNIEFKLDFKRLKFAVVGDWYNARTINDNPNQFTMNAVYVGVETHYARF